MCGLGPLSEASNFRGPYSLFPMASWGKSLEGTRMCQGGQRCAHLEVITSLLLNYVPKWPYVAFRICVGLFVFFLLQAGSSNVYLEAQEMDKWGLGSGWILVGLPITLLWRPLRL